MLFQEERINTGRQREIDVIKALAIVFMIVIHVYEEMTCPDLSTICSKPFEVILQFLGGPLAAPVFMFSMGLGMVYSRANAPDKLIKRGVRLFLLGYVLNAARYTLPCMLVMLSSELYFTELIGLTFCLDILQFAGLSFILTGILKKLKIPSFGIFVIAAAMQTAGLFTIAQEPGCIGFITGLFSISGDYSYFPLFQWYIYPAAGILFAEYLQHIKNTDLMYLRVLALSVCLCSAFTSTMYYTGYDIRTLFTLTDNLYYNQTLLHAVFCFSCIFMELSLVHFILKRLHIPVIENIIRFMSNNLNVIYIVQWIIIGWLAYTLLYFNALLPVKAIVPAGLIIILLSSYIAKLYTLFKKNKAADKKYRYQMQKV